MTRVVSGGRLRLSSELGIVPVGGVGVPERRNTGVRYGHYKNNMTACYAYYSTLLK